LRARILSNRRQSFVRQAMSGFMKAPQRLGQRRPQRPRRHLRCR
jgi:hypothetical protein